LDGLQILALYAKDVITFPNANKPNYFFEKEVRNIIAALHGKIKIEFYHK
jgi:hypothetical protein